MGGNAFQGLSRMTEAGYIFATNVVAKHMNLTGLHNSYFPKTFRKESYGDVDVFLKCDDKTLFEQDTGLLNIIDKRTNGNSVHYLCEVKLDLDTSFKFQVDLNYCDNPLFQAEYFSYGGLCVFLSLTAKTLGLKFNNKGLFLEKEYINLKGRKEEPITILIDSSFDRILRKLGFSPTEFSRITNFEEAVLFLKKSKYFNTYEILDAKIKQKFELLDYFRNNYLRLSPTYKNDYSFSVESVINYSYLAYKLRFEIKQRRVKEHFNNRFKFNRVYKLSKYLLSQNIINRTLTNEELGEVIKIAKDRYSSDKLRYESRASFTAMLKDTIKWYVSDK